MKHMAFWIWLISACVIALPAKGLAAYLIELKNGSQYVTHDYWEEGNQIKFNFSGGQIGFSKDSVLKITDTDLPVKDEIVTPEMPDTGAEPAPEAATPSEPGTEAEGKPEVAAPSEAVPPKIDHEAYKARKRAILLQYRVNEESYSRAFENNDQEALEAASADKKKTVEELKALNREIRKENNGVLPDWWHTETE